MVSPYIVKVGGCRHWRGSWAQVVVRCSLQHRPGNTGTKAWIPLKTTSGSQNWTTEEQKLWCHWKQLQSLPHKSKSEYLHFKMTLAWPRMDYWMSQVTIFRVNCSGAELWVINASCISRFAELVSMQIGVELVINWPNLVISVRDCLPLHSTFTFHVAAYNVPWIGGT